MRPETRHRIVQVERDCHVCDGAGYRFTGEVGTDIIAKDNIGREFEFATFDNREDAENWIKP